MNNTNLEWSLFGWPECIIHKSSVTVCCLGCLTETLNKQITQAQIETLESVRLPSQDFKAIIPSNEYFRQGFQRAKENLDKKIDEAIKALQEVGKEKI